MTTSRLGALVLVLVLGTGAAGAQTHPSDLPWAVAQFVGEGDWTVRLPQMLVRNWETLPVHQVTEAERAYLAQRFLDDSLTQLDIQATKAQLDLDKKRLAGTLPSTEPAATEKLLADLKARRGVVRQAPPVVLPLRATWESATEKLPWKAPDRGSLGVRSKAVYLVTGAVRSVGTYLDVRVELYSVWEARTLAQWSGVASPDEVADRMAEASDHLRAALLGRAWAGLLVRSPVPGSRVLVDEVSHDLPWTEDNLKPGPLEVTVRVPGLPVSVQTLDLVSGTRAELEVGADRPAPSKLVLETEPVGVSLFVDSQYLGPSPQTIDLPSSPARVRAQGPGLGTVAWEIGPGTASPSRRILGPPLELPSIPDTKDQFYWSLAAFSASLTTSAFLGAWSDEQVRLANAYAVNSVSADDAAAQGYAVAVDRYRLVTAGYAASVVLTTGLFVWMMVELGDYLGAAQASLP